jgi:hypothetical protein
MIAPKLFLPTIVLLRQLANDGVLLARVTDRV